MRSRRLARGRHAPEVWSLVLFLLFQAIVPGLHPETKPRGSCDSGACEENLPASSKRPVGCLDGSAGLDEGGLEAARLDAARLDAARPGAAQLDAAADAGADTHRHDPRTCGLCQQILHPPLASPAPVLALSIAVESTVAPGRPVRAPIVIPALSESAPRAPPCA